MSAGKPGSTRAEESGAGSRSDSDAWEPRFGVETPFELGVEEELLVVDAENQLAARTDRAVRDADPSEGGLDGELFKAMVESKSEICANAGEAEATLREIRRELLGAGTSIMGSGTHPTALPEEAGIDPKPRYELIEKSLRGVLRTPICGQHVHVGMPDPETAVRAYNGIRCHVPLINALASNSPFWFGKDSGLASARTVIFRSYPRNAMAPEFADFDHFSRVTREVCAAGDLEDYTHIWWDVRLHPALGTIEVRAADSQFDIRRAGALAALIHCLALVEADRDQDGIPSREALAESSFQATRHGLEASLLNRRGEPMPARDLAEECLELAAAAATELGCERELEHVSAILERGSGADLQLRVHEEAGLEGLLAHLVEETARLD